MCSSLSDGIRTLIWPAHLAGRFSRLLALGVVLLLGTSLVAIRALSLQPGSDQIADLIATQVAALRALRSSPPDSGPLAEGEALLEVEWRATPPESASVPWLPFSRRLVDRLRWRMGEQTTVLLEESTDRTWLWISPRSAGDEWLGLAVPPFRQQAAILTAVVAAVAFLLISSGGLLMARLLTRPLRRLAEAAPNVVAGEADLSDVGAGAPLEVRQMAAALQAAAAQARVQSERRELMLAGLSHDLRTPLARLRYALAVSPPEDPALAGRVEADLGELDELVGLFLAIGRGHAPREQWQTLNLADWLQSWLPRATNRTWDVVVDPDIERLLPAVALRRLLANLVQNAERHGAPPFRIGAQLESDATLCIDVSDGGPGIAEGERARLLRPFERASVEGEGWGLGLAVAVELASLAGAQLELGSADAGGLRARLTWRERPNGRP